MRMYKCDVCGGVHNGEPAHTIEMNYNIESVCDGTVMVETCTSCGAYFGNRDNIREFVGAAEYAMGRAIKDAVTAAWKEDM